MIKTLWVIVIAGVLGTFGYLVWKEYLKYNPPGGETPVAEVAPITEEQLQGMPQNLQQSYQNAKTEAGKGNTALLGNWLRGYGQQVDDPRKAWIELDYMVMISKSDPQEAKKIFAEVKDRTPTNSPVFPRIKQLEKTYQ